MTEARESASVIDRAGAGGPAPVAVIPAQRGPIASSDVPVEWMRHRAAARSWLRGSGQTLELASTTLLGLGVALAAPDPLVPLLALAIWTAGAHCPGRTVTTPLRDELRAVTVAALVPMALLAIGAATSVIAQEELRHGLLSVALPAALAMLLRGLRRMMQEPIRIVAVGDRAFVARVVSHLPRTSRSRVVAAVVVEQGLSPEDVPLQILGTPTYGDLERVSGVVSDHAGDLVLVDSAHGTSAIGFQRLSWALEGSRVAVGTTGPFGAAAPHRLRPGRLGHASVVDVREPRPSAFVRGVKRAIDRVLGFVALVAVSPLVLVLMLAVRVDSPGPALFAQTRVGRHGKPFRMYKLRTMVADADEHKHLLHDTNEADSVLFKIRRDPRITRMGAFLRSWSLDELPQLINVVRGEMSLVGPRPHLPEEVERMDSWSRRRHAVSPGITGMWQVSGRSDLSRSEASELDTHYADNWSLGGDAVILARTIRAVLSQRGAY